MADSTILAEVKLSQRITTNAFDSQLTRLISAGLRDLEIAGINVSMPTDTLILEAVATYVRIHFGQTDSYEYARLKASYDEQKAQLQMSTPYTDWGE